MPVNQSSEANIFLVTVDPTGHVVLGNPPTHPLTKREAATFAAWVLRISGTSIDELDERLHEIESAFP